MWPTDERSCFNLRCAAGFEFTVTPISCPGLVSVEGKLGAVRRGGHCAGCIYCFVFPVVVRQGPSSAECLPDPCLCRDQYACCV